MGIVLATALCACYGGKRASRDVNLAWQGHSRGEIEARWGTPTTVRREGADTLLIWTRTGHRIRLPSGSASVEIGPGVIDVQGEFSAGAILKTKRHVIARVDQRGIITGLRGYSLRRGAPPELNLRWGVVLGGHVGMGRLDDTADALPSGGLYIGGMLSRTVALVGTYSMAAGKDEPGGAMAFGWGLGVQTWVSARAWLRAGPAMVLAFDPGFNNAGLEPGVAVGGSYAIVRSGNFVLDLRVDLTGGTSTSFGTVGLGVNLN